MTNALWATHQTEILDNKQDSQGNAIYIDSFCGKNTKGEKEKCMQIMIASRKNNIGNSRYICLNKKQSIAIARAILGAYNERMP